MGNMKIQTKLNIFLISLVLALLLTLGLLGKVAYGNYQLEESNSQLNEELMTANLEIGKAETRFGNAQKFIKELEENLAIAIKKNNEVVDAYGKLEAEYIVEKSKKSKAKVVYQDRVLEVYTTDFDILKGMLFQGVSDKGLVLVESVEGGYKDLRLKATCKFTPKKGELEIPFDFSYKLHMSISAQIVKTHTKSGAVNYYVNLYETDKEGKKIGKLELKSFSMTTVDERAPQLFLWAPHLDIRGMAGLRAGLSPQWGLSIGVSAMGYGLTENDLSWRFLNASIDLSSSIGIGFAPFQYNLGEVVPLISNLWIGPHIGFNIDQEWYVGGSLGAQL